MTSSTVNRRGQKHRQALRASRMRPVQISVPDTRQPGFDEECRRQSRLTGENDATDTDMLTFLDEALLDVDDRRE